MLRSAAVCDPNICDNVLSIGAPRRRLLVTKREAERKRVSAVYISLLFSSLPRLSFFSTHSFVSFIIFSSLLLLLSFLHLSIFCFSLLFRNTSTYSASVQTGHACRVRHRSATPQRVVSASLISGVCTEEKR